MKKKEQKEKILKKEKIPQNPKDFIPNNLIDKLIPQSQIYYPQEAINEKNKYKPIFYPNEIPEEWNYNSLEEINEEINLNKEEELFFDSEHEKIISNLPLYLIQINNNSIQWDRPSTYIINYYIDREIKKLYPKKNYAVMRENIKESFIKLKKQNEYYNNDIDSDVSEYLKDDENAMKNVIYKDFYIYLEKQYEFKVVNYETQLETNEEFEQKIIAKKKESKNVRKKSLKSKKTLKIKEEINIEENKEKKNIIKPSVLTMKEFLKNPQIQNSYYTWLTSIFQIILDNNLIDVETGKSIFLNIYPQNKGVPIYNPKGKYIIKLYLMGKPRKIIIDDRIPCNKNHEYVLPQCNLIEEIWPALFIKALIKLNIYKSRHPFYYSNEEFMDNSLIYQLTGMHSFILDMNNNLIDVLNKQFEIKSDKKENNVINEINENQDNQKEKELEKEKEKEKNNKKKKSKDIKENIEEIKPIINYDLNEKYIFTVFNFEKKASMKFDENKSYYEIIEIIEKQNQKNINKDSQNISNDNEKILSLEKNIVKKISSKLLNQFDDKKEKENSSNDIINMNSDIYFTRKLKRWPTITHKKINNLYSVSYKRKEKLISDNKLITNFLYSICDFFDNNNFNMKRLKFLDLSDLQKELSDKKVQFKQLAANEKKQYLLFRQKLRKEKLEEKNKRLRELKENGIKYTLIKLTNQSIQIYEKYFFKDYTEEEIKLAKKCILNNWTFPPPETFDVEFEQKEEEQKELRDMITKIDEDSKFKNQIEKIEGITRSMSKKKIMKNKPIGLFAWTKEMYIEFIGNDLQQFKNKNDNPKISNVEGFWINFNELMRYFNKVLIIENQNKIYHNKLLVDNSWSYYKNDCFEPLDDYNIFVLIPNSNLFNLEQDKFRLIIIFEPYTEKFDLNSKIENVIFPYISFDLVNKSNKCIIQRNVILNKFYSIFTFDELDKNNEYFIKINGGDYPTGYVLQIMTEVHKIENLSFNQFLLNYENFNVYENQIYIPTIEKNKYYQFAKFTIESDNDVINEYIKIRVSIKYDVKYIKKFISIFLEDENSEIKNIELDKIIKINKKHFSINKTHKIIFSIKPEENLNESEITIKILYNESNLKFNYIEEIEPFEINDKYIPNKKGLIFSYYIYPSEKISTSMNLSFYHFLKEINQNQNQNPKSKKNENPIVYIEKKPIEKECRIILDLYKLTKEPSLIYNSNSIPFSYSNQGKLIKKWNFFNDIIIQDLTLNGDILEKRKKSERKEEKEEKEINIYLLICYFDLSEIDNDILINKTNDIAYTIRVFSSNNLGFIKDFSKEEHENLIKEEWEMNDMGRTLRASKSRKKYLLQKKKLNKEELNEEEKRNLEEERKRRTTNQIDHINDEDTSNRKKSENKKNKFLNSNKKVNNKNKNEKKKNENESELSYPILSQLKEQKSFSMSNIFKKEKLNYSKSQSKYIINYVNYSRSNRTIFTNLQNEKSKRHNFNSIIMSDEKRELKKKNIMEIFEKSEEKFKKHFEQFDKTYSDFGGSLKILNKSASMFRLSRMKKENKLLSQRNSIKDFILKTIEIKDKMNDIMKDNNIKGNLDFEELINVYKEGIKILGSKNENVVKFFSFLSKKKEEIIEQEIKKFNEKDKSSIIKIIEDIEYNKWEINKNLISRLKEMIKEEQ